MVTAAASVSSARRGDPLDELVEQHAKSSEPRPVGERWLSIAEVVRCQPWSDSVCSSRFSSATSAAQRRTGHRREFPPTGARRIESKDDQEPATDVRISAGAYPWVRCRPPPPLWEEAPTFDAVPNTFFMVKHALRPRTSAHPALRANEGQFVHVRRVERGFPLMGQCAPATGLP
jgi:hypothetical protein